MTNPALTLGQIQAKIGGDLLGDEQIMIDGIGTIQSAQSGQMAFVDNPKYAGYLQQTQASAVILPPHLKSATTLPRLIHSNPKLLFAQLSDYFHPERKPPIGVHPTAVIGEGCQLGQDVSIGPFVVLEQDVVLGDGVILGPHCRIGHGSQVGAGSLLFGNVTLYSNVRMGQQCRIHSGAVIGSDGFGYANQDGSWCRVPQVGGVRIGDRVEIGANTTIDRGTLDHTIIEDGVILDNLIQIGHNVKIGQHTAVAASTGIAGSCTIGAYCLIGGASIFNGHITIADRCCFIPGSQVANSIKKPGVYSSGIPAKDRTLWAKNVARFHQLDSLAQKVRGIQREVKSLAEVVEESKT